jgi:hypothetical protein
MVTREADGNSALAALAQLHHQAGLVVPALEPDLTEVEFAHCRGGLAETSRSEPVPSDPALDERIRAMQARLDRLAQRGVREVDRSLGR